MAGPTDVLTEDVKDLRASNRELAADIKGVFDRRSSDLRDTNHRLDRLSADLRDSNHRLTEAVYGVAKDLGNLRLDVAKELSGFRVEVTEELGAIKTTLEKYQAETTTSLRLAGRAVIILIH